jgi:hypothetical protein
VRAALLIVAACGGSATPSQRATPQVAHPSRPPAVPDRVPIDPVSVLAPIDGARVSWLVPGRIQLELGSNAAIEAPGGNRPIEVAIVERQGNLVRAVVRLEHARFSLWTDGARMLAVVDREIRVATAGSRDPTSAMFVALRPGARVRRLAHKGDRTQVRFVGALEVEGWVPDEVLVDAAVPRAPVGRIALGSQMLMVIPGAVVRTEPKWAAGELATMANGYFLHTVQVIDDAWVEVAYTDGDLDLHGYVSRQAPPGRVHATRDADVPPPTVVANATVASGTCLYARRDGEAIGYIVGDRAVQLDDAGTGWWNLAIDTPWGPIGFAARGPNEASLVACAPPGTVPPPAGTSP